MIANENENDIKLLNIDNVNSNFNTIKYNGKISINELNNNIENLSKSKNLINSKPENINDSTTLQVYSREKRQALYGIDCISDVVFSKWYDIKINIYSFKIIK